MLVKTHAEFEWRGAGKLFSVKEANADEMGRRKC